MILRKQEHSPSQRRRCRFHSSYEEIGTRRHHIYVPIKLFPFSEFVLLSLTSSIRSGPSSVCMPARNTWVHRHIVAFQALLSIVDDVLLQLEYRYDNLYFSSVQRSHYV